MCPNQGAGRLGTVVRPRADRGTVGEHVAGLMLSMTPVVGDESRQSKQRVKCLQNGWRCPAHFSVCNEEAPPSTHPYPMYLVFHVPL